MQSLKSFDYLEYKQIKGNMFEIRKKYSYGFLFFSVKPFCIL